MIKECLVGTMQIGFDASGEMISLDVFYIERGFLHEQSSFRDSRQTDAGDEGVIQ